MRVRRQNFELYRKSRVETLDLDSPRKNLQYFFIFLSPKKVAESDSEDFEHFFTFQFADSSSLRFAATLDSTSDSGCKFYSGRVVGQEDSSATLSDCFGFGKSFKSVNNAIFKRWNQNKSKQKLGEKLMTFTFDFEPFSNPVFSGLWSGLVTMNDELWILDHLEDSYRNRHVIYRLDDDMNSVLCKFLFLPFRKSGALNSAKFGDYERRLCGRS